MGEANSLSNEQLISIPTILPIAGQGKHRIERDYGDSKLPPGLKQRQRCMTCSWFVVRMSNSQLRRLTTYSHPMFLFPAKSRILFSGILIFTIPGPEGRIVIKNLRNHQRCTWTPRMHASYQRGRRTIRMEGNSDIKATAAANKNHAKQRHLPYIEIQSSTLAFTPSF